MESPFSETMIQCRLGINSMPYGKGLGLGLIHFVIASRRSRRGNPSFLLSLPLRRWIASLRSQ
jgi:hypothetical protein